VGLTDPSAALPGPIVVLGGGGFIGANLVRRLTVDGRDDVVAVDVEFPDWRLPSGEAMACWDLDLSVYSNALDALMNAGTVFHLAADMGGVGYFHSDADLGAAMRNGQVTLNVFGAAVALGVERLFYASSACCYPIEYQQIASRALDLTEDFAGMGTPDQLYGAEKLHGLRLASKVPNARVGILHTVYGPLQEHSGRRMKFPAAVATKALDARDSGVLELWGDGTQLRSYLHVDDAVERILQITAADHYDGPVNVGAEGAITCREIAELCLDLVGVERARIVTNPAEPSGVLSRDCSNAKYDALYGPGPDMGYRAGFRSFLDWLETVR
jgi:GDP-D-mannose 3', 5'-epimerase